MSHLIKILAQLINTIKNVLNKLVNHIGKEIATLVFVTLIMLVVFETLWISLLIGLFFLSSFLSV